MAIRLRKRQNKDVEEDNVDADGQTETASSSEQTPEAAEDETTESPEAEMKHEGEEQEVEQDPQMNDVIEVKGNSQTVSVSWEKSEEGDVKEEETSSTDQVTDKDATNNEEKMEIISSADAVETTEEVLIQPEETKTDQEEEECDEKPGSPKEEMIVEDGESAPTVAVTQEEKKEEEKEVDTEKETDRSEAITAPEPEVEEKPEADSATKTPPSKKTKVPIDGFCLFVGNLNRSKTSEEVKTSLSNFLQNQNLQFEDIRLYRSRKYALVDLTSETDLTKALTLNGQTMLDKPIVIRKAVDKSEEKMKKTPQGNEDRNAKFLVVKNLPFNATKKRILEVFRKGIDVSFPDGSDGPTQSIAFVEFENAAVAKRQLKRKQGVKFHGRVLIVESVGKLKMQNVSNTTDDNTAAAPPKKSLLVSNLSDEVKERLLKKVFPKAVNICKDNQRGFAFVEFASRTEAQKALAASEKIKIGKRTVRVQLSDKTKPEEVKVLPKSLVVMGLAEKTSAQTLKSAFEGALSARVVVDKQTGLSRRFGFVEFESEDVCKAAKEAMEDCEIDGSKVTVAPANAKPPKAHRGPKGVPQGGSLKHHSGQSAGPGDVEQECGGKGSKLVSKKRKADPAVQTSPPKRTKHLNDGFCLFVGNLNHTKPFNEVKNSLANHLTDQCLLFQDIRLDKSRKHAFVDLATEMDLLKALALNGQEFLDKPMKLAKATVNSEDKTPPLDKKEPAVSGKNRGAKRNRRGSKKHDLKKTQDGEKE